jgi:hypothetical protein
LSGLPFIIGEESLNNNGWKRIFLSALGKKGEKDRDEYGRNNGPGFRNGWPG